MSIEKWSGSKSEVNDLVHAILKGIREEVFPTLSQKVVNKLFSEAFCRNVVHYELREMMVHIHEEE